MPVVRLTREEKKEKLRTKMRIKFNEVINYLIDLCKGRVDENNGWWFYKMFLNRSISNCPTTLEEVRYGLQNAWWIEEEDIKQQIYLIVLERELTSNSDLRFTLARNLRDYLTLKERVFHYEAGLYHHGYLNSIKKEKKKSGFALLEYLKQDNNEFSLFDRYFFYLYGILKLPRDELSSILVENTRFINRFELDINQRMEDMNVSAKDASRYC